MRALATALFVLLLGADLFGQGAPDPSIDLRQRVSLAVSTFERQSDPATAFGALPAEAVGVLMELVTDPNVAMFRRLNAITGLAFVGDPAARNLLLGLVTRTDLPTTLRSAAASAAGHAAATDAEVTGELLEVLTAMLAGGGEADGVGMDANTAIALEALPSIAEDRVLPILEARLLKAASDEERALVHGARERWCENHRAGSRDEPAVRRFPPVLPQEERAGPRLHVELTIYGNTEAVATITVEAAESRNLRLELHAPSDVRFRPDDLVVPAGERGDDDRSTRVPLVISATADATWIAVDLLETSPDGTERLVDVELRHAFRVER